MQKDVIGIEIFVYVKRANVNTFVEVLTLAHNICVKRDKSWYLTCQANKILQKGYLTYAKEKWYSQ